MSLYFASLPLPYDGSVEQSYACIESGRQQVLDDLQLNPSRPVEDYALAAMSFVYASLLRGSAKWMLDEMAVHPLLPSVERDVLTNFALHKTYLEGLRRSNTGADWCEWACCVQAVGLGIASAADELAHVDQGGHGHPVSIASEFVRQVIAPMPEYNTFRPSNPVVRPVASPSPIAPPAEAVEPPSVEVGPAVTTPVIEQRTAQPITSSVRPLTTTELAAQWLAAKCISSPSELSRKNRSAALFCEAMGLSDAPATELANIGNGAVKRFINHPGALPTADRSKKTRISNVKSFIAYVQSVGIAVPELDWSNVK